VILIGLAALASVLAWFWLPAQVPMHYNVAGEVDRYGSKWEAVLFMPLLMLGLLALFSLLPRLDPRRENYAAFAPTYQLIINATLLFLLLMHGVLLAVGLGLVVDVPRLVGVAAGVLFAMLGNVMGRVQQTWFVGVRTPWTLSDPEVWRRTNRVSGRVMVAAGLLIVLTALFLPTVAVLIVVLASSLFLGTFAFAYSYVVWKQTAATRQ
jgi:uncharacterized membrane protein